MISEMHFPAFLVQNGVITCVNQPAAQRTAQAGMAVSDILVTGHEEYERFHNGSLYLTVCLCGIQYDCCVTQLQQAQLFVIDEEAPHAELQALALAAKQLYIPLFEISLITDRLSQIPEDDRSKLRHHLHRLQRIIANMSDTGRLTTATPQMISCELCALFEEVFEKSKTLLSQAGINIIYQVPSQPVYSLAEPEMLKRAAYNLISNAAKFTISGKPIQAALCRSGSRLYLSVSGNSNGNLAHGSIFKRYTRQPGFENTKFGIGLGMTLINAAATAHGGAVLAEQTKQDGFRITMTISIKKAKNLELRSAVLVPEIYGGQDQALIELSDVLPYQLY